jgi:chromosome segregation protein
VLKLRKVELLGFKSFCEKTNIVFSGSGVTCIIGPNGCGKSNVVDAVSWVLGEQSHKMLRAERMSDCIFNGTAKRPPMGISEVSLTLVDPELAEAAAKVLGEDSAAAPALVTDDSANPMLDAAADSIASDTDAANEDHAGQTEKSTKSWKKRGVDKPAVTVKPGEVVVGRRLYRSGQSEYLINGRVARLRDVQELFMGMGLGPDSYAIIEQGRIGQILNSRPMDRRALIEEAAGITVYKTKRRLAEAKLEAAKVNLSRVNDILVEVEKQLASLKRQASKARRYAELRDEMRGLMRSVLASKARHLEMEAERLESALSELVASESAESAAIRELEAEQESLDIRNYELEGELRQLHNLLNQAALELDRAENRIAFNREQEAQVASRISQLASEIAQAEEQTARVELRLANHREAASKLREESSQIDSHLQDFARQLEAASTEQISLDQLIASLRDAASRSGEDSVRAQVESLQAEDLAARITAEHAQREEVRARFEQESHEKSVLVHAAETHHQQAEAAALDLAGQVREAQQSLAGLRISHQQAAQRHETTREELAAARARRGSLEQILNERAYTAEAVQKLFSASAGSEARGFRAVGVLADYAEVEEQYEGAIEQFLRDELEYVVVETFDHARAGIALLREEMGGRATFFVDSLRHLKYEPRASSPSISSSGVVSRLDNLVDFREPLGPAAKNFLSKLQAAYLIETSAEAEKLARENPDQYFVTLDGTCFHGRMVTGGRPGEAGPLALKRELRMHEAEVARLEHLFTGTQAELRKLEEDQRGIESALQHTLAAHVEAEKSRVSAFHQLAQARDEAARAATQLDETCKEVAQLAAEVAQARERAAAAHQASQHALLSRTSAEQEAAAAAERLVALRQQFQSQQAELATRREEFAAMAERLANAETLESRLAEEANQSRERLSAITAQRDALLRECAEREASNLQLAAQAAQHRTEKERLEQRKTALESQWNSLRERAGALDADLRAKRDSFEQLRSNRNQREIEKARNDSDREHLRQTCVAEANAQPEELIAQQPQLLSGEELALSESNYLEKKERLESMGPVNMMALEEFQECDQRNTFLARERDDLVESIQNTQQAITELDTVSREKFEQAFNIINRNFSEAFRTLFGGGTGEMRLTEPDSSGDCGIDVVAQPPGKRLQNILLLSGGEKAMTALALLIAVFRFQPSPFCILDEVDAPLDEANVGRFNRMLMDMGEQTQFIIVTHNRKTMEMGSVLYGVTMQEPGVSKLVSVRWEEAAERAKSTAA